jgi:electron-transferring-flavoprotein dehydrogenase
LWQYFKGGTLRSWAAKSLLESGKSGEPFLAGDGYAMIGETSGSTNVLTGSGVDEAWATGVMLGEGVLELLNEKRPFTKENLQKAYAGRRSRSWVEQGARKALHSRDGFHYGFISGVLGMGLTGMTGGLLNIPAHAPEPYKKIKSFESYFSGRITSDEIEALRRESLAKGVPLHDAIMDKIGWPPIPFDGKLLVTHQDVLLMGGKVQAPAGYRDHVIFADPEVCRSCRERVCISMCSGQAITAGPALDSAPVFDREKCIHCGACLWNCSKSMPGNAEKTNVVFSSGAGGLHSAEN